jgi:hypothetical protein
VIERLAHRERDETIDLLQHTTRFFVCGENLYDFVLSTGDSEFGVTCDCLELWNGQRCQTKRGGFGILAVESDSQTASLEFRERHVARADLGVLEPRHSEHWTGSEKEPHVEHSRGKRERAEPLDDVMLGTREDVTVTRDRVRHDRLEIRKVIVPDKHSS